MEREKLDKAAEEAFEDYLLFSETTDSKSSDDFISGFKQGATKALAEQWRSVKDELPEDGVYVLLSDGFGRFMGYYSASEELWYGSGIGVAIGICYWLPVPELPKNL